MDISQKINDIIIDKLNINRQDIKPESNFTNDLGADSLDTVELIMELEKEFNIKIADEDAEKIKTVQDAINFIEEKIKK